MYSNEQLRTRARELMLQPQERDRYVHLATTGECPDCGYELPDRFETTIVNHARLCKGAAQ